MLLHRLKLITVAVAVVLLGAIGTLTVETGLWGYRRWAEFDAMRKDFPVIRQVVGQLIEQSKAQQAQQAQQQQQQQAHPSPPPKP